MGRTCDGYIVLMDGEIDTDPLAVLRLRMHSAALAHAADKDAFATIKKEINRSLQGKNVSASLDKLASAGLTTDAIAAIKQAALDLGDVRNASAKQLEGEQPNTAVERYTLTSKPGPACRQVILATTRLGELAADEAFQLSLGAEKIWDTIVAAESALKRIEGARASYTDSGYQRANKRSLSTILSAAKKLMSQYPDTIFNTWGQKACQKYHIPLTDDDKKAAQRLASLVRLEKRLRPVKNADSSMANPDWAKRNGNTINDMKEIYQELTTTYASTAYGPLAEEILIKYGAIKTGDTAQ